LRDSIKKPQGDEQADNNSLSALARDSLTIIQRDVLTQIILFVSSIVIARQLGPLNMGLWSILMLLPAYVSAFGRLQIDTAATYFISSGTYTAKRISFVLLSTTVLILFLLGVLGIWQRELLFSSFLAEFDDKRWLVYLTAVLIPLEFLHMAYSYLLLGMNKIAPYNTLAVLRVALPRIGASILLLTTSAGIELLLLLVVASTAVSLVYGIYQLHSRVGVTPTFEPKIYKDLISYGLKLYAGSVLSFLAVYVSSLFVAIRLPATSVGFFLIAQSRVRIMERLGAATSILIYPRVAASSDPTAATLIAARAFRFTLFVSAILTVLGIGLTYPAVRILYGNEYAPVSFPLIIMIPGVTLSGATQVLGQYFLGIKKPIIETGLSLGILVLQLILLYFLLEPYGVTGAAISVSISLLAGMVARITVFWFYTDIKISEILLVNRRDLSLGVNVIKERWSSLKQLSFLHRES